MTSRIPLLVFFLGISLVSCDFDDPSKQTAFASYAESNKPLDMFFTDLYNFLESNTDSVEKVIRDIKKIQQNLKPDDRLWTRLWDENFVIKNALESVQNYRVSSGKFLKTIDLAFNWIEKRVPMITGNQSLVDSMRGITEIINKIKLSMTKYKTDIEKFMEIVSKKASVRYSTDTIAIKEVGKDVMDKVLRIESDFLAQEYKRIKDSVSNVVNEIQIKAV